MLHAGFYMHAVCMFHVAFSMCAACILHACKNLVFSRSAKPRDVIVFPYVHVQTGQTRFVHAAACALRDKMAVRFVLMFVKPPQHYAEILQKLVVRY